MGIAVWKINSPNIAIQWTKFNFSTKQWSNGASTLELPSEIRDINGLQVALDPQGNAVALFLGILSTPNAVLYGAALNGATNTWSTPQAISDTNNSANLSSIAVDSAGNAIAVWTEAIGSPGANQYVKAAQLSFQGNWGSSTVISN